MSFETLEFDLNFDEIFSGSCEKSDKEHCSYLSSACEKENSPSISSSSQLTKDDKKKKHNMFERFNFKPAVEPEENLESVTVTQKNTQHTLKSSQDNVGKLSQGCEKENAKNCPNTTEVAGNMVSSTTTSERNILLEDGVSFDVLFEDDADHEMIEKENVFNSLPMKKPDKSELAPQKSKFRNKFVSSCSSPSLNTKLPINGDELIASTLLGKSYHAINSPSPKGPGNSEVARRKSEFQNKLVSSFSSPSLNAKLPISEDELIASTPLEKGDRRHNFSRNSHQSSSCFESPVLNTSFRAKNTLQNSVGSKRLRKRKFPGPAGLLPDLPPGNNISVLKQSEVPVSLVSSDYANDQEFICSQASVEEFQKLPWQNMLKDLSRKIDVEIRNSFNVKNMLQKAKRKMLPKYVEAKLLCVLLVKVSFNGQDADATFRDETDEILGRIDIDVFQTYRESLTPGAVIVLKKAAILCNQLLVRKHNVVTIYDCDGKVTHVSDLDFKTEHPGEVDANDTHKEVKSRKFSVEKMTTDDEDAIPPVIELEDDAFLQDDLDDLLQNVDSSCFEEDM